VAPTVFAVSRRAAHAPGKERVERIRLVAGLGVDGDVHAGVKVKHRYDARRDPDRPNLRQVHLIAAELHHELRAEGFAIGPGEMGENVPSRGVDLTALPAGTRLRLGESAVVELTGTRNPCRTLDKVQPGLMKASLGRDRDGNAILRTGAMAVVIEGGEVTAGDPIAVELRAGERRPLAPV
jgi:MOSC domain-containing protein YiiM